MGMTVSIDSLEDMCGLMCDNRLPVKKMKRIVPDAIYRGRPCSVVAVGCAAGISSTSGLEGLYSRLLRSDGYLSLRGMDALVRANLAVLRRVDYRRGKRPVLRDWAHAHPGTKAVICVLGHYLYFDGKDYYSFLKNGGDEVVAVWELT